MSLLKSIWKGSNSHKKLSDELDLAGNEDFDGDNTFSPSSGSTYNAKYLGHVPVDLTNNTQKTTELAIDSIILLSKAKKKKNQKVLVSVSLKGIEVTDTLTSKSIFDVTIFRVCSCLAYAKSRRIFAFLATNTQAITECHVFLCPKRSVAENLAMTVAEMFTRVYAMWKADQGDPLIYGNLTSYRHPEVCESNAPKQIEFEALPSIRSLAFAEVYAPPEQSNIKTQRSTNQDWINFNQSVELIKL